LVGVDSFENPDAVVILDKNGGSKYEEVLSDGRAAACHAFAQFGSSGGLRGGKAGAARMG
jgi:hypothetical protein